MLTRKLSRRRFLASTAAASIGITAPHVRGAHAAGKLSMGFWDHWVPGANSATTALVKEWAEKEKVDIAIDYIPSQGNKLLITITAEAQARAGHDILAFPSWQPAGERQDVVARLGLRFGGPGQQELVALGGDEVDRNVDLLLLRPLLDQGLGGVVGVGDPVIPQADGQLARGMGAADERSGDESG